MTRQDHPLVMLFSTTVERPFRPRSNSVVISSIVAYSRPFALFFLVADSVVADRECRLAFDEFYG